MLSSPTHQAQPADPLLRNIDVQYYAMLLPGKPSRQFRPGSRYQRKNNKK